MERFDITGNNISLNDFSPVFCLFQQRIKISNNILKVGHDNHFLLRYGTVFNEFIEIFIPIVNGKNMLKFFD